MRAWKPVAWTLVLVTTTFLTWQIVSFADTRVSARPVEVTALSQETTTTRPADSTTTTKPAASTTIDSTPSTTVPTAGSSSPSVTVTTAATWALRSIPTSGGTVLVRHRPGLVELQTYTPAPGYEVEVDESGPERVRIEFHNGETEIRVRAEWREGVLDIEVSGD